MMAHEWYSSYDALVPRVCPDYELGLDAIVNSMPTRSRSILELGSGTGNLTLRLAQRFPQAKVIGIDIDTKMLESAKKKTGNYENVNLIKGEFPFVNFGRFDAVVSSLLFHLMSEKDIIETLEKIYKSRTKYITVFDRMKGETLEQEELFLQYFAAQLQGNRIPNKKIKELIRESRKNNPMKLSEHRAICEANRYGFEILHQNPNHGFMVYRSSK
ncbi:MAG: class I SAM-dependent methyltransferase [Nanoarchaeota archaeon]